MQLTTRSLIMAFLAFVGTLFIGSGGANADGGDVFSLVPTQPTLGSIDCLRPAGILSPACPYELAAPGDLRQNINPGEVGVHRVLRLLANERLHGRFAFLKPYDPDRRFSLPVGFSAKMIMGYPGANMYLDLQDLSVDMRLFGGGTIYPFDNDEPYAAIRFSWRW